MATAIDKNDKILKFGYSFKAAGPRNKADRAIIRHNEVCKFLYGFPIRRWLIKDEMKLFNKFSIFVLIYCVRYIYQNFCIKKTERRWSIRFESCMQNSWSMASTVDQSEKQTWFVWSYRK